MDFSEPRLRLFVDADACPVKDEAYKVAALDVTNKIRALNQFRS